MTQFRIWQALLTGSRAYGIPNPGSDVDIVIRMELEDVNMLKQAYPEMLAGKDYPEPNSDTVIFNFGAINLLCVTSDRVFAEWIQGTLDLRQQGPVTREFAVRHFEIIRSRKGGSIEAQQSLPLAVGETEQVCLKCGAYAAINCTIAGCPQTVDPSKCTVCHQSVTEACLAGDCDIPF